MCEIFQSIKEKMKEEGCDDCIRKLHMHTGHLTPFITVYISFSVHDYIITQ